MPMSKRLITPVDVSRNVVDNAVRNELECVSNNTLANLLLQLSSLSKMSEDLFTEIHIETCCVFYKTCQIIKRVEALKIKIIELNPIAEEVSLKDITQREPFRSEVEKDQEIITVGTRPRAINDMYLSIEKPPCLQILDPYREDGKKSMKFYTDPGYFFDLWQKQMAAGTEVQKKKNAKVKRKSSKKLLDTDGEVRTNAPNNTNHDIISYQNSVQPVYPDQNGNEAYLRQLQEEAFLQQQYEYEQQLLFQQQQQAYQLFNTDSQSAWNSAQQYGNNQIGYKGQGYVDDDGNLPPHPSSPLPPPENLPEFPPFPDSTENFSDLPPPPPIFPDPCFEGTPPMPTQPLNTSDNLNDSYMPSPPQNLPTQQDGASFKFSAGVEDLLSRIEGTHLVHTPHKGTRDNTPVRPASTDITAINQTSFNEASNRENVPTHHNNTNLSRNTSKNYDHVNSVSSPQTNGVVNQPLQQLHPTEQPHISPQPQDERSDLLKAIRQGIQLRKVAETKQQRRRTTGKLDVQSIMEAAFEVRRKAMERDDEDEDDDEENDWSD